MTLRDKWQLFWQRLSQSWQPKDSNRELALKDNLWLHANARLVMVSYKKKDLLLAVTKDRVSLLDTD